MAVWRWIETGPARGAFHMAADRALLENVSKNSFPTMRVYSWKPACISLGCNQSDESLDFEFCRKRGIEAVRRFTGGRAVLHDRELTYSIVFPEGTPFFLHGLSEIYNLINRGLLRGIQQLGVPAMLEKRTLDIRNHYRSKLSTICFSAAAKYEITVQGKKLVGSAQRRTAAGVLQHGSIPLRRGELDLIDCLKGVSPEEKKEMHRVLEGKSITLQDALGRTVSFREAASAIRQGMSEALHIQFRKDRLTELESKRSHELMESFSVLSVKRKKKFE